LILIKSVVDKDRKLCFENKFVGDEEIELQIENYT